MTQCDICEKETDRPSSIVVAHMGGERCQVFTCRDCANKIKMLIADMITKTTKS